MLNNHLKNAFLLVYLATNIKWVRLVGLVVAFGAVHIGEGQDLPAREGVNECPYEVVKVEVDRLSKNTYLFVVVEEKSFIQNNLVEIFRCLSGPRRRVGNRVSITIVTDRTILNRIIEFEMTPRPDFTDTPEGRKAARQFYERYAPPDTGYYRAFYSLGPSIEYFDYSKDKNNPTLTRVDLRAKSDP